MIFVDTFDDTNKQILFPESKNKIDISFILLKQSCQT